MQREGRVWLAGSHVAALLGGLIGFGPLPEQAASIESPHMHLTRSDAKDAGVHPSTLYKRAVELFGEGKRDEAVFWFYAGQLRYRFLLAAHPDLPRDSDPALFAALSESVGRPINEWAAGDPDALAATLNQVLAWDAATPNTFTPKERFPEALEKIRGGLVGLRDMYVREKPEILRKRIQNGLSNRVER